MADEEKKGKRQPPPPEPPVEMYPGVDDRTWNDALKRAQKEAKEEQTRRQ